MRVCASCVCQPLQVSLFYFVFGYVYGLLGALDRRPSLDKSTFYQFFFFGGAACTWGVGIVFSHVVLAPFAFHFFCCCCCCCVLFGVSLL